MKSGWPGWNPAPASQSRCIFWLRFASVWQCQVTFQKLKYWGSCGFVPEGCSSSHTSLIYPWFVWPPKPRPCQSPAHNSGGQKKEAESVLGVRGSPAAQPCPGTAWQKGQCENPPQRSHTRFSFLTGICISLFLIYMWTPTLFLLFFFNLHPHR